MFFSIVENGVETVEYFENDVLKSRTVNGQQQLIGATMTSSSPTPAPSTPAGMGAATPNHNFNNVQSIRIRRHV